MRRAKGVLLVLPWLLSAALTVAVVWLAVELRQSQTENEQVRQKEQAANEVIEQRRRYDEEALQRAKESRRRAQLNARWSIRDRKASLEREWGLKGQELDKAINNKGDEATKRMWELLKQAEKDLDDGPATDGK